MVSVRYDYKSQIQRRGFNQIFLSRFILVLLSGSGEHTSNVGEFPWSLFLGDPSQVQKEREKSSSLTNVILGIFTW